MNIYACILAVEIQERPRTDTSALDVGLLTLIEEFFPDLSLVKSLLIHDGVVELG